jgi:hypothetical protein
MFPAEALRQLRGVIRPFAVHFLEALDGFGQLGHITREGAPVVRQLVAEAAWQAVRRSPTVRAYFGRAQRGDPQRKKIALVATADYLVRVMWALLKRGTVWQENEARAG